MFYWVSYTWNNTHSSRIVCFNGSGKRSIAEIYKNSILKLSKSSILFDVLLWAKAERTKAEQSWTYNRKRLNWVMQWKSIWYTPREMPTHNSEKKPEKAIKKCCWGRPPLSFNGRLKGDCIARGLIFHITIFSVGSHTLLKVELAVSLS